MKKRRVQLFSLILFVVFLFSGCEFFAEDTPVQKAEGILSVHIIDVGQADSILLQCNGENLLIDAGNNDDNILVYDYLQKQGVKTLQYAVGTHAHEDHIGGLDYIIEKFTVETLLLPMQEQQTKTYQDVLDAADKKQLSVTRAKSGDSFSLGNCKVEVFGPVREDYKDLNDSSIVLKVTNGENAFLFTGDLSRDGEADIIEQAYDLRADVLKVGHHGSESSSSYVFLREIMPKYAVLSVGENNDYGHPHESVMSRLNDVGAAVYRTDTQGSILIESDGETISFYTQQDIPPVDSTREPAEENSVYIGNINSKKLHVETCSGLPSEANRVYFASREEALANGYTPCGNCNP